MHHKPIIKQGYDMNLIERNNMTNRQLKREAAKAHNALYDAGKAKQYPSVLREAEPSQRHALAAKADRTSATPSRSQNGKRMRERSGSKIYSLMKGRHKINMLFARAGIRLGL